MQSRLSTRDQQNRNYNLGLDGSDLSVVNVLFSKRHIKEPFFFFFFSKSLILNLGGYVCTNWNNIP